MITLRIAKAESRRRDAKRKRALLKIGGFSVHLSRKEVLSLFNQADRFLMDTARISSTPKFVRSEKFGDVILT